MSIEKDSEFCTALIAAGLPVDGTSSDRSIQWALDGEGKPVATPEQLQQAEQIKKDFDWRERVPKSEAVLRADLRALDVADLDKLYETLLVERLQSEPDFGRKLGIAIDGDEVA